MRQTISILFLLLLFSCSKESRFVRQIEGSWLLDRMQVTDGQLVQHVLEDASGSLDLNFADASSDGFTDFYLNINAQLFLFSLQFQGEDLLYLPDSDELVMGTGDERMTYKVILQTKKDLVLEYYDALNFQLRKFVFIKEE